MWEENLPLITPEYWRGVSQNRKYEPKLRYFHTFRFNQLLERHHLFVLLYNDGQLQATNWTLDISVKGSLPTFHYVAVTFRVILLAASTDSRNGTQDPRNELNLGQRMVPIVTRWTIMHDSTNNTFLSQQARQASFESSVPFTI